MDLTYVQFSTVFGDTVQLKNTVRDSKLRQVRGVQVLRTELNSFANSNSKGLDFQIRYLPKGLLSFNRTRVGISTRYVCMSW